MGGLWLLKTEPSEYSYDDLESEKRTVWNGVTNALALKHLRQMRKGDRAIFYHTGNVRAAVAIAKVLSDPYPDPEAKDEKIVVVDVGPDRRLAEPVPLAAIKKTAKLASWELVRIGRLSVMPATEEQWSEMLRLAGE